MFSSVMMKAVWLVTYHENHENESLSVKFTCVTLDK